MPQPPVQLDLAPALEHLRARAAALALTHPRPHLVIGVTGPAGSGKSHLARCLSACIVATDDYLPDYDATPEHLRDLPEHADLPRLRQDLASLAAGNPTRLPTWCFHEHRRTGHRDLHPAGLIVCEGLHALHATLHPVLDLLVYIDAPADARWARIAHRERAGERGWGIDYSRHFFHNVAEPTFERLAPGYQAAAHVIVRNADHTPGPDPHD